MITEYARVIVKGLEEDGSCALHLQTPMSMGNVSEMLEELGIDENSALIEPMKLADTIFDYQKNKGYFDYEDWIDGAMKSVAHFCVNAADLGAKKIVFVD